MNTIKDLKEWVIEDLGNVDDYIHIVQDDGIGHGDGDYEHKFKFYLYTFEHAYAIVAIEEPKKTYLGCIASLRKPRAGEDWTRGNDLPDGPLTKETWNRILKAIVTYELEPLNPVGLEVPDEELVV